MFWVFLIQIISQLSNGSPSYVAFKDKLNSQSLGWIDSNSSCLSVVVVAVGRLAHIMDLPALARPSLPNCIRLLDLLPLKLSEYGQESDHCFPKRCRSVKIFLKAQELYVVF